MILGGQGVLGAHLSREFAAAGWDVIPTGRKPDPRPGFRRLDLREGWMIAAAIADADVVVNTVPDESTTAEQIVLREGGILINVSALPATASWKLRRERLDPCGSVVMNAGIAPGVTNLVAAELLAAHPEADEVELVFTVSSEATVGRAGREFAHRGLTAVGHHRTTVVPLPEPFGERRCLGFAEPERGWLGAVADAKQVSLYVCVAEAGMQRTLLAANRARLLSRLPRSALRSPPLDPERHFHEPIRHWVAVLSGGERIAARTVRCRGDYRAAASSAVAFAAALRDPDREPPPPGVFDPDELFSAFGLADSLARYGITICEEEV